MAASELDIEGVEQVVADYAAARRFVSTKGSNSSAEGKALLTYIHLHMCLIKPRSLSCSRSCSCFLVVWGSWVSCSIL